MTTANPFPGLRPFESGETHLFFGRDGQSEELIRRLGRGRFLAVVGTSGSGKSSLVRAGLLPALQGGLMASAGSDWRIAMFRPGHDPVGNLARALTLPEVFGSDDAREAEMQAALTEATLRRSSLGLLEAVRQARGASGPEGRPRLLPYENLLVVVDQFEELFRFRRLIEVENSKEDAAAFVRLLLEAGSRPEEKIYVVLTMRSDFLGDCAQFQGLPEAINDGQYLIPRMTRDERREAVTGPVAVGGGHITDPLVNQLLNDMGDNPDQLPILQHALMRTWDYWLEHRRNGEPIDLPHYHAVGGMGEALSRHAEEAYAELGEAGQEQSARQRVAETLFKALTEKGADNREIRRPVELGEAAAITELSAEEVAAVVEVFRRPGRSFLMPPAGVALDADSLIDISHESLIRNWERLKRWTDEEAQSARIYRRLAETAVLHKAGEEALYKDPALQFALDWRDKNRPNAVWARRYHPEFETATSFLDASVAAREAERKELEKQRRRDVSYKRTRLAALFLALSFLLAAGATVYAYNRMSAAMASEARALIVRNDAVQERERATAALRVVKDAEQRAREDREEADRQRAAALAARNEAVRRADAATASEGRAEAALAQANAQSARNAAVAAKNAEETKRARQLLYPSVVKLAQQAYESDNVPLGRDLLFADTAPADDPPGFEWHYLHRLLYGELYGPEPTPGTELLRYTASHDGKFLTIAAPHHLEVRDLTRNREIMRRAFERRDPEAEGPEGFSVGALALSPNGKVLAVGNGEYDAAPALVLYDTATGAQVGSVPEQKGSAAFVNFSQDGKLLTAVFTDGEVVALDVPSCGGASDCRRAASFDLGRGPEIVALSPDGKLLAGTVCKGDDSGVCPVNFWNALTGERSNVTLEPDARITALAFNRAGDTLATGGPDAFVRVWDVAGGELKLPPARQPDGVTALEFSPDDMLLAVGFEGGAVSLSDSLASSVRARLKGHQEAISYLHFSEDGGRLFTGGADSRIKVWDVNKNIADQNPISSPAGTIDLLAVSPKGDGLVAAHASDVLFLSAATGDTLKTLGGHQFNIREVAYSPDGRQVATGGDDGTVRFWDASTGGPLGVPVKPFGDSHVVASVTFSHDGRLLAAGSGQGEVALLDARTRTVARPLQPRDASTGGLTKLAFSRDDTLLGVGRERHSEGPTKYWVEAWDLAKSEVRVYAETGEENDFAFSPTADLIAVGREDGTIAVLHTSGALSWELKGHRRPVTSLAFTGDGRRLASGSRDGTVKIWNTTSWRELLTLSDKRTPTFIMRRLAFSPEGRTLFGLDITGMMWRWSADQPSTGGWPLDAPPSQKPRGADAQVVPARSSRTLMPRAFMRR